VPLVYEPEPCNIQNFSANNYSHDLLGVNPLIDHHCCYECGNSLNDFFFYQCTCKFCGNGAHFGYNCQAQVPSFQTLPSFPQQYPCCEYCRVLLETDHCQPPQYTINHPIFNAYIDLLSSRPTLMEQMEQLTSMCEMFCQFIQKKQEEKQIEEEQTAKAKNWELFVCYNDDDDEESSNSLEDNIISELPPCVAITPTEPVDSLSIEDEHLDTILPTKSDEFIKSSVKNLVSNLRINETDCHLEEETHFTKRLLYDNSSPRPPEEIVSDNSNADIESFSPSPIPNTDSDSHMEEINLPFTPDDPMPPGIEDDDYDSGRDIPILEELLDNYSLLLPDNESYHFDIPSPYRPPAKPPDGKTRTLNIKMMGDVSNQKIPIPGLTITRILNQEKSPDLLPHQGLEAFQPSAECPRMIINGKNTPLLDGLEAFQPSAECPRMIINGKNTPLLDVPLFQIILLRSPLSSIPGNVKTLAK
nr:hypothetical protein [Tanacetum cinerariifolium]